MTRAIEAIEPGVLPACSFCQSSGDGIELKDFTDEGDPSVGYGPHTVVLCDDCAKHKGLIEVYP